LLAIDSLASFDRWADVAAAECGVQQGANCRVVGGIEIYLNQWAHMMAVDFWVKPADAIRAARVSWVGGRSMFNRLRVNPILPRIPIRSWMADI